MLFHEFGADPSSYPLLSAGDTGSYVAELQTRLNAAGTSIGDGKAGTFDAPTTQAVINFQNGYSLHSDGPGVVGNETWAKLLEVTPSVPASGATPKAALPGTPAAQAQSPIPIYVIIGAGALFLGLVALALGKTHKASRAARSLSGHRRRRRRR